MQSRIKMLEKIERIDVPPERKRIHFQFPAAARSGRTVLTLKGARKRYGDKLVLDTVDLHVERGDRIALVGHNGAGKSTLMRMLSGEESPDAGERIEGHQVVTQYFAQDEATRLDPALTVYETLAAGSPDAMIPAIRNILGGFLFSGDDVYKKAAVLSGGERTRLAVARMLLRPSNTLLLDEPTNHLDIDSKEVLLDALTDYGGTLVFVSHDRYFVERLATKIVEVGGGRARVYPGTYSEFLWSKEQGAGCPPKRAGVSGAGLPAEARPGQRAKAGLPAEARPGQRAKAGAAPPSVPDATAATTRTGSATRRSSESGTGGAGAAGARRRTRGPHRRAPRRPSRPSRPGWRRPGSTREHEEAKPVLDEHQALMWKVGDLLGQWEMLQAEAEKRNPDPLSGRPGVGDKIVNDRLSNDYVSVTLPETRDNPNSVIAST